ncbi:hypothetical protein [Klebsiella grimontii]|uniref:hypothetical protein n=1 Tax=Klebsiella grimontii TaxID=2058152 RepID=UPI001CCE137F|nr:hypothetical protein [Klebsiella grimontii]MBZ7566762.1 hypothetical protein [Klebsiella grimontii]MDU2495228.1 hypothetical protein [Klebsiella grimontii]MDU3810544.1 hypothetical protein [Klebsiella grimontii]
MTTDITELTSVQKNANIHRLSRLIAYAPNDELRQMAVEVEQYTDQLIEALEKAQTKAVEQGRTSCELFDEVTTLRQRIAELESRSVKLPSELELRNNEVCSVCAGNALQVIEDKLTAAGIKWEAE